MSRFLSSLILGLSLLTPSIAGATPPVIWSGDDAEFINPGTIIVPGLAPGGVCTIDSGGVFAASTFNSLFPSQTGNNGKFLQTNGTSISWQTAVTNVTSSDGSLDITSPATTPDVVLHFPINTGGGDIHNGGFGIIGFSTLGTERLRIENNGDVVVGPGGSGTLYVNGAGIFTGNISAANYPPTGSANTLARFDNSGVLAASAWSIDPDYSNLTSIVSPAASTISDFWQIRNQTNLASTVTGTTRSIYMTVQSSGTNGAFSGIQLDANVDTTGDNAMLTIQGGATVGGNSRGASLGLNNTTTGDEVLAEFSTTSTIGGGFTGFYTNSGPVVTGNAAVYAGNFYGSAGGDIGLFNVNSSGNAGNNFRASSLNNSGTVAQFGSGYSVTQSGAVTKGYDAFSSNVSANVGDGSGTNLNFLNAVVGSGITVDGGLFLASLSNQATVTGQIFGQSIVNTGSYAGATGLYWNNSGNMTGNNQFSAADVSNSGTAYSVNGYSINNSGALTEQFRGFRSFDSGGARTATGGEIILQGTYADDARGLKIDVSGASSTNQFVQGLEVTGGKQQIYGTYKPKSAGFVDIGSYFAQTATIDSGTPITGTDMFLQFFQSNLNANDDVSGSPLGLDINMLGAVHQVTVASGKTLPLVRGMMLGVSVPSGSGGTITEHVGLEILGLPSFGGSVTNPTRIGLQDSQVLGQSFCDGTTDCWGIRWRDPAARHWLRGGIIIGGTTGNFSGSYDFETGGDALIGGTIHSGSDTNESADTNSRHLIKNGYNVVDWNDQMLVDESGDNAIDWKNRILKDAGANDVVDFSASDAVELKVHLKSTGSAPTATVQASAGTGASCSVSSATDAKGQISITTGTLGLSTGSYCQIGFNVAYGAAPICVLTPASSTISTSVYVGSTTTTMDVNFAVAGGITSNYLVNYHCLE